MSRPRVGWTLSGRPPAAAPPVEPPPAEQVLAVGDQVTVTLSGGPFEATVTAVTANGGAATTTPPPTDPAPDEQPGLP